MVWCCVSSPVLHSFKGLGAVEQLRFHSALKFMSTANNPKIAKFGCASYPKFDVRMWTMLFTLFMVSMADANLPSLAVSVSSLLASSSSLSVTSNIWIRIQFCCCFLPLNKNPVPTTLGCFRRHHNMIQLPFHIFTLSFLSWYRCPHTKKLHIHADVPYALKLFAD